MSSRKRLLIFFPFLLVGCASGPSTRDGTWRHKLRRVGLEPVTDEEAGVPVAERNCYVCCRVRSGFVNPVLDAHPAGYLLVEARSAPGGGREALLRALDAWRAGKILVVRVRRNPYREIAPEWWEKEVQMWLPPE